MEPMNYINHSRLKAWRRCARLYDYKYERNLQRKKPKLQLIRGSIIHELIDAYAKGDMNRIKKNPEPEAILQRYAQKYRTLFSEEREIYGDLIGDCRKLYERYVDFHQGQNLTFIASELEVSVPLIPGTKFVGRIDKIGIDPNQQRWLVDHKTHKKIPDEKDRFLDLQTLFYVWAYNEQHPKERVVGVVWDYIRTKLPTIPEILKSGQMSQRDYDTDHETYRQALVDNNLNPNDYGDYLLKLKGKQLNFFKRVYLPNPKQEMIDEIVNEARQNAKMIRALAGTYKVRSMSKDCSWCDFLPLCQAELRSHDANFILKSEYTERDPESYDAEEGTEED